MQLGRYVEDKKIKGTTTKKMTCGPLVEYSSI
jgi:hypothetical protein